jgi:MinD superfamily P-loop ATPase
LLHAKVSPSPDQTNDTHKKNHDCLDKPHVATLGQIPFDTTITHAMVKARTILEYGPSSETSQAIQDIWQKAAHLVFSP